LGDRLVAIVTPEMAGFTVRGSHPLVTALLFVSPEYAAFQLNEPAVGNV
jgi:hypothetical protein